MRVVCAVRSFLVIQREFVNFLLLWVVSRSGRDAEVRRGVHLLARLRLVVYSHTAARVFIMHLFVALPHVLLHLRRLTLRARVVREPARARFRTWNIALKLI